MAWLAHDENDHGDAFDRPRNPDAVGLFEELWPSGTFGSGKIARNNRRTGSAQGRGSFLRKAYCQLCGYPNDLNKIDHSGGSEDGDGNGGGVNKSTATGVSSNPLSVISEIIGDQSARNGAGCALCFSKHSSKDKFDIVENMNPIPPFGF